MANTILKHMGKNVGKSICENDSSALVKDIFENSKKYNCEIIIPSDVMVSSDLNGIGNEKDVDAVMDDEMILDIGPKTIINIEKIIDKSKTVLWNGPAGYFENINFSTGTISIAKKISDSTTKKSLISILGGGDTISAINKSKEKFVFTHLSTAGGAFLEFLEGKDLPGLNVLK